MDSTIIRKLMEKPEYYQYLKENSDWIKVLRENPKMYDKFVKYVKEKYKLRTVDKINNAVNTASMLTDMLNELK